MHAARWAGVYPKNRASVGSILIAQQSSQGLHRPLRHHNDVTGHLPWLALTVTHTYLLTYGCTTCLLLRTVL